MANMSYCRFENTNDDLADCEAALDDLIAGEGGALSSSELSAAQHLVRRCQSILAKLSELPHQMGLENDGDEVNALEFDFDLVIDLLQAAAEGAKESDDEE